MVKDERDDEFARQFIFSLFPELRHQIGVSRELMVRLFVDDFQRALQGHDSLIGRVMQDGSSAGWPACRFFLRALR